MSQCTRVRRTTSILPTMEVSRDSNITQRVTFLGERTALPETGLTTLRAITAFAKHPRGLFCNFQLKFKRNRVLNTFPHLRSATWCL